MADNEELKATLDEIALGVAKGALHNGVAVTLLFVESAGAVRKAARRAGFDRDTAQQMAYDFWHAATHGPSN
ncbi:hypothetical protein [Streptomyces uncialis]|uniref:Uncharacterized protein n=1 Tax=Streptomyces uncialis TaxID=1048205 RepID=A0A1Q4VC55_9ACTN|nr:hypothetical protein [Streptomyces uncialis]OKH95435.1 hypothetical protein AB852_00825 [Streptomyces uncialis]